MNPLAERGANDAKPQSLVADAYRSLKDAIRDNVFAPGFQGSEQEIALRLGMSRTPVHEALIRLQEEGLVRVLPKRGVMVCALSPDDMREVYDVIIALEGVAAELLAGMPETARKPALAALEAINTEMKSALQRDDLVVWAGADDRFPSHSDRPMREPAPGAPRQHDHGPIASRAHDDAAIAPQAHPLHEGASGDHGRDQERRPCGGRAPGQAAPPARTRRAAPAARPPRDEAALNASTARSPPRSSP